MDFYFWSYQRPTPIQKQKKVISLEKPNARIKAAVKHVTPEIMDRVR
jgi:hypothetical protein